MTLRLGNRPDSVAEKLPARASLGKALVPRKGAPAPAPKDDQKKVETGFLKRFNAARDHEYYVYVPDDYDPNYSYGLLLWLHSAGKGKEKDLEAMKEVWADFCSDNRMILVAPRADGDRGWVGSESDFVQQAVRDVMGQYTIDRQRVVAHGMGVGGQMAYYLGFNGRDLFRGVATTGAVLASQVKDKSAAQPLQFFLVAGGKDPLVKDIQEGRKKLVEKKYSVVYREIANMGHQYLDEKTLIELARWMDALDQQ